MSRNFYRFFTIANKLINKNNFSDINIVLLGAFVPIHCVYALCTNKEEKTIIIKKYKMVRNGFTDFMVIDIKNRHFNINNSLWYWKWNSIEDWCNIKEGNEIRLKYYGLRIPLVGLFPNIYMSSLL